MSQVFKGKLISFETPRVGETTKGEWANVTFVLREFNPANEQYAQEVKMSMFKNGEYVKYAKNFDQYYKIGDVVEASFNFKKNKYTKDGEERVFYGVDCWKLQKTEAQQKQEISQDAAPVQEEVKNEADLPF